MSFLYRWCCTALFLIISSNVNAAPQVLTSIKPLALIAAAITDGVTQPEVLLPAGASPHSHSLKPSDVRKLKKADLFFWVGPSMESFLPKILKSNSTVNTVTLIEQKGIHLQEFEDEEGEHHHHHDGHDHGPIDGHIWLSTDNARTIAKVMAKKLSALDEKNTERYQANLTSFINSLNAMDARNKKQLQAADNPSFFVFHDGYGYLETQYDLNVAGFVTTTPDQQPGAKHLYQVKRRIKDVQVRCLFIEPQLKPAYIEQLTKQLDVTVGELDPLADSVALSASGYVEFIEAMISRISRCR